MSDKHQERRHFIGFLACMVIVVCCASLWAQTSGWILDTSNMGTTTWTWKVFPSGELRSPYSGFYSFTNSGATNRVVGMAVTTVGTTADIVQVGGDQAAGVDVLTGANVRIAVRASDGLVSFPAYAGAGTRTMCVRANGELYASAGAACP